MRTAFIITMYDEFSLVLESIKNIRKTFNDAEIIVVQSDANTKNNELNEIKLLSNEFICLENLGEKYSRFALPSKAITRNISTGVKKLYEKNTEFDLIVILTGDTLITDADSFHRRYIDMINNQWVSMVSQAIGQNFHSDSDNPENGIFGGRYQDNNTTDFACCLFLLDGKFARETIAFSNILITNKWTSEQCLGDELVRAVGSPENFKKRVGILNGASPTIAYSYNDGIIYHAKTNGQPSR